MKSRNVSLNVLKKKVKFILSSVSLLNILLSALNSSGYLVSNEMKKW